MVGRWFFGGEYVNCNTKKKAVRVRTAERNYSNLLINQSITCAQESFIQIKNHILLFFLIIMRVNLKYHFIEMIMIYWVFLCYLLIGKTGLVRII